jgi:hypothetical protein
MKYLDLEKVKMMKKKMKKKLILIIIIKAQI